MFWISFFHDFNLTHSEIFFFILITSWIQRFFVLYHTICLRCIIYLSINRCYQDLAIEFVLWTSIYLLHLKLFIKVPLFSIFICLQRLIKMIFNILCCHFKRRLHHGYYIQVGLTRGLSLRRYFALSQIVDVILCQGEQFVKVFLQGRYRRNLYHLLIAMETLERLRHCSLNTIHKEMI